MARTSAANPAALEASPAAVGKLFWLTSLREKRLSFGRLALACSSSVRRVRREERQAWVRGVVRGEGWLLRRRESWPGGKKEEQEAVVWVRRSDWERVTEREELVGRLRVGERLPQYLWAELD